MQLAMIFIRAPLYGGTSGGKANRFTNDAAYAGVNNRVQSYTLHFPNLLIRWRRTKAAHSKTAHNALQDVKPFLLSRIVATAQDRVYTTSLFW
jgi:hypothetical protein